MDLADEYFNMMSVDLAKYRKDNPDEAERFPMGCVSLMTSEEVARIYGEDGVKIFERELD